MAVHFGDGPPWEPGESTVKTLFASSKNVCQFSACEEKLTDPEWDSVNAEIAHIRGERPRAPRYDATQSNKERHGFHNLMLLCPKHHKEVDRLRPKQFPAETLIEMKAKAESHTSTHLFCGKDALERFVMFAIQAYREQLIVLDSVGAPGPVTGFNATSGSAVGATGPRQGGPGLDSLRPYASVGTASLEDFDAYSGGSSGVGGDADFDAVSDAQQHGLQQRSSSVADVTTARTTSRPGKTETQVPRKPSDEFARTTGRILVDGLTVQELQVVGNLVRELSRPASVRDLEWLDFTGAGGEDTEDVRLHFREHAQREDEVVSVPLGLFEEFW